MPVASNRTANWIAIFMLAFSTLSIPTLFTPLMSKYDLLELAQTAAQFDAKASESTESAVREHFESLRAESERLWFEHVLFFVFSVFAALVTFWRGDIGAWLVLLICTYVLYMSGPAFVRMVSDGGLVSFASVVFSTTTRHYGLPSGLVISWHLVVSPFAYSLLALSAICLLWHTWLVSK